MSHFDLDTLYRQVIMDHYKHPRNRGTFEDESLTVEMNNPTCGDRIFLQFKLDGDIVEDVKFTGEGCSISLASASMMTQAIKGKTVEEALAMSELFSQMMLGKDIDFDDFGLEDIEALQGVSNFPARIKCATLAWKAMERVHKK
ncbi:MAG TPA: SUF system NifU family Fe-S cluster assembly protein [Candidatus Pseudogracilibacillus intestinigallinarum]|uniref:SUF system NifU family Fe-S cluster assembly protein n=1 Tax=Candidatus Pseudogracilibacillus intestinigallinarum TaxID=2838742 RepID=A0A9D1TIT4_9BACI|nr:SUF system NifU family Fe-S cluster assembly protein [Candidatus Pseudogracilibacillus intestinigallinarum]